MNNIIKDKTFILLLISTVTWGVAFLLESELFGFVSALIGSLTCLWSIINILKNRLEMLNFLRLSGVFLYFYQNISWLIASYVHKFYLDKSVSSTLKVLLKGNITLASYFEALLYIFLFSLFLVFLGNTNRMISVRFALLSSLDSLKGDKHKICFYFMIIYTLVQIILIATGVIGQRSILLEGYKEGEQSILVVIFQSLGAFQLLVCSLLTVKLDEIPFNRKKLVLILLIIFSIVTSLFIYFNKGRTPLLFSLISLLFWYRFFSDNSKSIIKILVIMALLTPLISQALLLSNFIRGENGILNWQKSAIEVIPEAWRKFNSSTSYIEKEKQNTINNLSQRPLVASPLASCMNLPIHLQKYTLGENIINSIVWTIPGGLINKNDFPIQEILLYKHFPITTSLTIDTADSIYLSAYTEFQWLGIIIYGFLYAISWRFLILVLSINKNSYLAAIGYSLSFYNFVLIISESSLNTWFVAIRSVLFFSILFVLYRNFVFNKR